MKTCPRCARKYPDSEAFCEADGSALVAGSAAAPFASGTQAEDEPAAELIECPVCGGKAQPGEVICNFCGARLLADSGATPPEGGAAPRPSPESFVPSQERLTATNFTPPPQPDEDRGEGSGRSMASVIGYAAAALVALAAGAWLALHLSSTPAPKPQVAVSSPAATPAAVPMEPTVELAHSVELHTFGVSASAPERNQDAARKMFEANRKALLDAYRGVVAGGATVDDGMMVRVTIAPSGEVTEGAVRTSTAPNPELDASVVKSMMGWRFTPFNGENVKADYPIIFARNSAQAAAVDSSLAAKVAALGPSETPEYASAPAVPVATPSPAAEALAPVPKPAPTAAPKTAGRPAARRRAAVRPRPLPLLQRVESALRSNRKLGRVKAYTNGSVVTLYGRVFDNTDRLLAERTARRVSGVSDVINQVATDEALWAAQQRRIEQSLAANGLTGVTVKVIGSDAYLNGEVKTELDRERAVTIAEGAAPVKVRTNLIRVATGRVFGF